MKLSDKTIKQVKENRDLIEAKDWLKIWETLGNSQLNSAFVELGYNPLIGLKEVPPYYFYVSSVKSVVIPHSVKSIGKYAFADCDNLTSVVIPANVSSIGERAFYKCNKLTSVVIEKGVRNIGEDAFRYCKSLTSVVIPDSVTSIDRNAFRECTSLTELRYLGTKEEVIGVLHPSLKHILFYDSALEKIICTDGVVDVRYT